MSDDDLRAELVRLAYGDDSPAEVSADARRRLESFDAQPAARLAARLASRIDDAVPVAPAVPADVPPGHEPATRRPLRRLALVGVIAGTLAVGLVAGGAIESVGRGDQAVPAASVATRDTQPIADETEDPAQSSRLAAGDASVSSTNPPGSALAEADALLARPATSVDTYPLAPATDDAYVDSSIRLVATSATGLKFYIARQRGTAGGYCLLEANAAGSLADGSIGTSACTDPASFQASGMTLTADRFSMTWTAGDVSVRLTGNGSASG